ncbi:MAG: leucine-rich repeat protein [Prevotella sp.]|nr:leucine-rich repeat protein [Prevotella sp.]
MKKILLFALIAMCWSVAALGGNDKGRVNYKKIGNEYIEVYEKADNSALLRARSTGKIAEGDNLIPVTKRVADPNAPGGFRLEETFEVAEPAAARLVASKKAPTEDGEEFVANTVEGVPMKFKVLSATTKTCQVGYCPDNPSSWSYQWACIDNKYNGSVTIPSQVEGYTVTKIGGAAFYGCSNLTGVTIPETVVTINRFIFRDCKKMTSLYIPANVIEIKTDAFAGSTGRSSIVVDPNNPIYDSREDCNAVIEKETNTMIAGCKNTIIPSTVTKLGDDVFYGCDDLESINIPANITDIGWQTFDYCSGLNYITVTNNAKYDSRQDCNAIIRTADNTLLWGSNNTVIPSDIVCLNYYAFEYRTITGITLPESLQEIRRSVFRGTNLKSITIPSKVNIIDDDAFDCYYLEDVTTKILEPMDISESAFSTKVYQTAVLHVPDGTKGLYKNAIGWRNFQNIDGTGDDIPVELKDGDTFVETISNGIQMTFTVLSVSEKECAVGKKNVESGDRTAIRWDVSGAVVIPDKAKDFTVKEIAENAFEGCHYISSVEIPNTVVTISDFAFAACYNLKSIYIPASVRYISNYAFANSTGREKMEVDPNNPVYESLNSNAIINKTNKELVAGCKNTVIPASVTKIGQAAFYSCNDLGHVFIPSNITEMGSQAFAFNSGINTIVVDDENTVFESGKNNCIIDKSTKTLLWASNKTAIPSTVESIGRYAFTNRTHTTVYIPEGVSVINSYAFYGCSNLSLLTLPTSLTSIDNYAFYEYSKKLAVITCCMTDPLTLNNNVFHADNYNAKLNIPAGTTSLYQAAGAWSKFTKMVERSENIEKGDASGDGVIDTGDVATLVELLTSSKLPESFDAIAADTNNDGVIDISDIIRIINMLLSSKP